MQTIWFKRMVSVLLLSALALSVAGCQSRYTPRESSSAAPSAQTGTGGDAAQEEVITVYYLNDPGFPLERTLRAFSESYSKTGSNITIEKVAFQDPEALKESIQSEGFPDVLLLRASDSLYNLDPQQWIDAGQVLALNDMLEADDSFQASNYIAGLMESGQVGGQQYYMPLSVEMQALYMPQSNVQSSGMGSLSDSYTLEEFLHTVSEAGEHYDYTYLPQFYDTSRDYGLCLLNFLQQTGALQINRSAQTVHVNESILPTVLSAFQELYNDILLYTENAEAATLSFAEQQALTATSVSNITIPMAMRYMQSGYFEFLGQEATAYYYPLATDSAQEMDAPRQYAAMVNLVGLIGSESEHAQAAYDFLRHVMDLPASNWLTLPFYMPNSTTERYQQHAEMFFHGLLYMTPVNLNQLQQLTEQLASSPGGSASYKLEDGIERSVTLQPLTDTQLNDINHVFSNITQTYMLDGQSALIVQEALSPYLSGESDSTDGLAASLQSALAEALEWRPI